jgi:galactose oxidase
MLLRALLSAQMALAVTLVVSDQHSSNEGSKAVDSNTGSFWHSQYQPSVKPFPHIATLDLGTSQYINGFSYVPRQDSSANGRIGQYILSASPDNVTYTTVATGSFIDDKSKQLVGFPSRNARYVRITTLSEAGNRGNWSSAAEFDVVTASASTANGQWSPIISLPLVAAAAFINPLSGKVVTFASDEIRRQYQDGDLRSSNRCRISSHLKQYWT